MTLYMQQFKSQEKKKMALKKPYNFKGQTAEYWRLFNVVVNKDLGETGQTRATLGLYFDHDTRLECRVSNKLAQFGPFVFDGVLDDMAIYDALKTIQTGIGEEVSGEGEEQVITPFFADAEDV